MRAVGVRRRVARRGGGLAAAVAALALLAACGASTGTGNGGTNMPGMPASTAHDGSPTAGSGGGMPSPAAPAPSSTGTSVAIKNLAFTPGTLTVPAGTTVTWTNADEEPHTVSADNGGPFHSSPLDTGGVFRYTFAKPGTYTYYCTIHPFMHGTVVVRP